MGHAGAGRREESQDGYGRLAAGVRLLHDHPARSGFVAGLGGKLERPLPLFTRLPQKGSSRQPGFRQILFSETRGYEKSRGVENPGGKVSWALHRRGVSLAKPTTVTMTPHNKAVKGCA